MADKIRRPVVSGTFYPFSKASLDRMLSRLFDGVPRNNFVFVVSPHAGYEYSGRTAAFAISSLKSAKNFIILGPNHNAIGHEFAIVSSGSWETPLGNADIDTSLAKELLKCDVLIEDELGHAHEHSIEVQLPFLKRLFAGFKFVPISIFNIDYSSEFLSQCETLGKQIAKTIRGKNIGVIASSDFSHYLPAKIADSKDAKAIEMIKKLDPKGFFETLEEIDASVCGYGPIAVLMYAAKNLGMKSVEVVNHTNSGDGTGDYSSVVAYYAIGFR